VRGIRAAKPGRPALLAALLAGAFLCSGCLATISSLLAPPLAVVDEPFTIAVDGVVSGSGGGCAAIVAQIPDSLEFLRAYYVTETARRRLRPSSRIAAQFTPEPGHRVLALADSIPSVRESEGRVRAFITMRASTVGAYTLKFAAGALHADGGESVWMTHSPADVRNFKRIESADAAVGLTVVEAERNGTTALAFTGSRDFLELPDSGIFSIDLEKDFSAELWISTVARDAVIFSTRADDLLGPFPIEIAVDEYGAPSVLACDGSRLFRTRNRAFMSDGMWHHLAVSYSAAERTFSLYMDAHLVDSLTAPPGCGGRGHPRPTLGARPSRRKFLNGVVDEVRFWSASRSKEEVMFYKNTALSGYEQGLAALYSFEKSEEGLVPSAASPEGFDAVAWNKPRLVPSTAPLKVELISFSVSLEGNNIAMSWESYDESKVSAFHVEKRTEASKYTTHAVFEAGTEGQNHRVYRAADVWQERSIVYYRLRKINKDGSVVFSDEAPIGAEQVLDFALGDNQPNPFAEITEIPYTLTSNTHATLRVYDLMGREVADLVSGRQKAGSYTAQFDATDLPPGPYFFKMQTKTGSLTKKMYVAR